MLIGHGQVLVSLARSVSFLHRKGDGRSMRASHLHLHIVLGLELRMWINEVKITAP